jgi:hypothetical protein
MGVDSLGTLKREPTHAFSNDGRGSITDALQHSHSFNPVTTIDFSLTGTSFASLTIYDLQGSQIAQLVNDMLAVDSIRFSLMLASWLAGSTSIHWK